MSDTPNFRALCAELACSVELLLQMRNSPRPMQITEDRLKRARAALATPEPELLSPGAQKVLDAVVSQPSFATRKRAAATLRALADQIAPTEQNYEEAPHKLATVFLNGVAYAANEMRLIATELEGHG